MSQTVIQETLIEKYQAIKSINQYFSQRAFAKKLGTSSGTLSLIMRGERKISKKMALRFATNLELERDELGEFLSTFSNESKPNQQNVEVDYIKVEMDKYRVVTKWYHFAILSLMNLDNFVPNHGWISSKLGLTLCQVDKAIERLILVGLIKKENSTYIRTSHNVKTSDGIKNDLLKNAHRDNLEIARKKLDDVDLSKRDYTAQTLSIDPNKLDEAKKLIRTFHSNLSTLLESDEKRAVYKICIQLFPLTNDEDNHEI